MKYLLFIHVSFYLFVEYDTNPLLPPVFKNNILFAVLSKKEAKFPKNMVNS